MVLAMNDRPATVKLTASEWETLILSIIDTVGLKNVYDALYVSLGTEKAEALILQRQPVPVSKAETAAMIRGVYPFIPGNSREEKIDFAIVAVGRKTFPDPARFAEVIRFARQRVEEYESAPPAPPVDPVPPTPPAPPVGPIDELDISNVIEASSGNRIAEEKIPIVHELKSVSVSRGLVNLDNDLPGNFWNDGRDHLQFCRCYCYWQEPDGQVYGGHFDWLRPGQRSKTLDNLQNGYYSRKPYPGARLFFAFVANSKYGRTNVKGS